MGLLAFPQMLRAGYDVKLSAGAITAGGCLGILIPPSVMLIVYGATAGVSVVQLYAGAFFPGLMLAGLYIIYVILVAKLKPEMAPPLSEEGRRIDLPPLMSRVAAAFPGAALSGLLLALKGRNNANIPALYLLKQLLAALLPAIIVLGLLGLVWNSVTRPDPNLAYSAQSGAAGTGTSSGGLAEPPGSSGLREPPGAGGLREPPGSGGLREPSSRGGLAEPPGASGGLREPPASGGLAEPPGASSLRDPPGADGLREPSGGGLSEPPGSSGQDQHATALPRVPAPTGFWIGAGAAAVALIAFYAVLSFQRFEVFKMLLSSFFPLVVLILSVLGSIVFGLATPTEAAAVGAFGGFLLAAAYRQLTLTVVKDSAFLTAKTSAMVCWLFVGSSIFSAAFALLGGQELVEKWVLSMNLSKTEFLILSQVIIFLLGWPLEWTEIIVIFMPIFIPLLDNFGVDPLFFGLLVALNLQTAFLSPPVAMAAFYLKGVSPPHVTLNQIFRGMLPFMGIQVFAIVLLYVLPEIGLWLPKTLYGR
jgi:TRAP-type mannitol/chloroaromatic compound transport system permease large subunit